jgi:hypothetical protein
MHAAPLVHPRLYRLVSTGWVISHPCGRPPCLPYASLVDSPAVHVPPSPRLLPRVASCIVAAAASARLSNHCRWVLFCSLVARMRACFFVCCLLPLSSPLLPICVQAASRLFFSRGLPYPSYVAIRLPVVAVGWTTLLASSAFARSVHSILMGTPNDCGARALLPLRLFHYPQRFASCLRVTCPRYHVAIGGLLLPHISLCPPPLHPRVCARASTHRAYAHSGAAAYCLPLSSAPGLLRHPPPVCFVHLPGSKAGHLSYHRAAFVSPMVPGPSHGRGPASSQIILICDRKLLCVYLYEIIHTVLHYLSLTL